MLLNQPASVKPRWLFAFNTGHCNKSRRFSCSYIFLPLSLSLPALLFLELFLLSVRYFQLKICPSAEAKSAGN
jgi:hypothetical protein